MYQLQIFVEIQDFTRYPKPGYLVIQLSGTIPIENHPLHFNEGLITVKVQTNPAQIQPWKQWGQKQERHEEKQKNQWHI